MIEATTEAEAEALRRIGWHLEVGVSATASGGAVLVAYRAGFRDGGTPPRVFVEGDPEPGSEVRALLDGHGDVWLRSSTGWGFAPGGHDSWLFVVSYGPLVSCPLPPDYEAVVQADRRARAAAAESAGGAR